jgi:hypothetical protein
MEDPCYAYLDCDLLDNATLTMITLKVKLTHIKMNEHHMQKCMFVKVKKFRFESKSKRGFEKGDMHLSISIYIIEFCPSSEALLFFDWLLVAEEKRSKHTCFACPRAPSWLALMCSWH